MTWKIVAEHELTQQYTNSIEPFWHHQVIKDSFLAQDGTRIQYCYTQPSSSKGTVVISNGRIETFLKYKELMYDLWSNGFAVFTLDHRGQGLSERLVDDVQLGYVRHFDDYVSDMIQFVNEIVRPRSHGGIQLVCHSMGGAIGALTMIESPTLFEKAFLCAPMFGIKPALPDWLAASLIGAGKSWNGLRRKQAGYFFGQGPYLAYPFKINPLTHSETRYRVFRDLYDQQPDLQLGGVTTEWLDAARDGMNKIEREGKTITTPTLIVSAGGDLIIDNKRQRRVASTMPTATYEVMQGGHHELFNEADEFRVPTISKMLDFLTQA